MRRVVCGIVVAFVFAGFFQLKTSRAVLHARGQIDCSAAQALGWLYAVQTAEARAAMNEIVDPNNQEGWSQEEIDAVNLYHGWQDALNNYADAIAAYGCETPFRW